MSSIYSAETAPSTSRARSLGFGSRKRRRLLNSASIHLVLSLGAFLVLIPFLWTISSSLKTNANVLLYPPQWIPDPVVWENYPKTLTIVPFATYFRNTLLITLTSIVGTVLSSAVVAFAFARLRWWGRDAMFIFVLSTMMLPFHITMIPQFVLFSKLGWVNTFLPLIVPNFFGGAFYIFLLRQFFMGIPLELDEAARLDGASTLTIFTRIVLPLAKPPLAAVAIFTGQACWNDFLGPLIYLSSESNFTLSLGLRALQAHYQQNWPSVMVGAVVTVMPLVIVFFFAQKYFIQGVVFTGIKG